MTIKPYISGGDKTWDVLSAEAAGDSKIPPLGSYPKNKHGLKSAQEHLNHHVKEHELPHWGKGK